MDYTATQPVFAYPQDRNGVPGYAVIFDHGGPCQYQDWFPTQLFERCFALAVPPPLPANVSLSAAITSLHGMAYHKPAGEEADMPFVVGVVQ